MNLSMTKSKKNQTTTLFPIVIFSLLLTVSCAALEETDDQSGEPVAQAMLSTEQLHTALGDVLATIDEVHYKTLDGRPASLAAAAERAYDEISKPMTEEAFGMVLGRLLTPLKDGHAEVDFHANVVASYDFIELPMVWLAEGPIVTTDTNELQTGDRIVSIGGMNAEGLMNALSQTVSHDNDYALRHVAPLRLGRGDWLRGMNFVDNEGSVEVVVEREGDALTVHLPLTTGFDPDPRPNREFVGYTIDADHRLGIFYLDESTYNEQFQETLDVFMQEVTEQGIKKIAIDLRYNRGGDAIVAYALLAYLGQPFDSFSISARLSDPLIQHAPLYADQELVAYLKSLGVDTDRPTLDIPGEVVRSVLMGVLPNGGIVESELIFHGELYVLVSPTTFSSAQLFTALIQDNKLGTVIGEPTANTTNFTGDQIWFDVADTELRFSLGASWLTRPDSSRGDAETLTPDVLIARTQEDIINRYDPQLAWIEER